MILAVQMYGDEGYPDLDFFRTRKEFEKHYKKYPFKKDGLIDWFEFKVTGTTYKEKQSSVYIQLHDIANLMRHTNQSYRTLAEIQNWIMSKGVTYGLLKELREDGII